MPAAQSLKFQGQTLKNIDGPPSAAPNQTWAAAFGRRPGLIFHVLQGLTLKFQALGSWQLEIWAGNSTFQAAGRFELELLAGGGGSGFYAGVLPLIGSRNSIPRLSQMYLST